jgi:hypothetical protein
MVKTHRFLTKALIVCFAAAQWRGTLVASEQPPSSSTPPSAAVVSVVPEEQDAAPAVAANVADEQVPSETEPSPPVDRLHLTLPDGIFHQTSLGAAEGRIWRSTPTFLAGDAGSLAQRGGYRGGGRGRRNDAARAAIVLGAVAAIAGTSVLVYANRPECSVNGRATACGYGTKVVGTAVLSGGIVGLLVGALTWR